MGAMSQDALLRPAEIEQLLANHHVRGLTDERGRVLLARFCGVPVEALAAGRAKSPSAVRQDLQAVRHAVFDPLGLRPDPFLLAWWVTLHRACCLAGAFQLAEKKVLLTG